MTAAVGGDGPRMLVGVIEFEEKCAGAAPKFEAAVAIGKIAVVFEGPENAGGEIVDGANVGRNSGDNHEAQRSQGCVGGKSERDVAVDAIAGEIEGNVFGIVDFDVLEIARVGTCRGMIHDLADDKLGALAGGAEGVGTRVEN